MLHQAIRNIGDTGSELILLRRCADKVTHLFAGAGDIIADLSLQKFDKQVERSLSYILRGDLFDQSILQASLGVQLGGLGLRSAVASALRKQASAMAVKPAVVVGSPKAPAARSGSMLK